MQALRELKEWTQYMKAEVAEVKADLLDIQARLNDSGGPKAP